MHLIRVARRQKRPVSEATLVKRIDCCFVSWLLWFWKSWNFLVLLIRVPSDRAEGKIWTGCCA